MQGRRRLTEAGRGALVAAAVTAFSAYCIWNVVWIVRGRLPPSMLSEILGIPAPTTGMTRSWIAIFRGDAVGAFLWNPLTLPLTILYGFTLWVGFRRVVLQQHVMLPRIAVRLWLILLPMAWIVKFLVGPGWW